MNAMELPATCAAFDTRRWLWMASGQPWEARTFITVPSPSMKKLNLVVNDAGVAAQLEKTFQEDLQHAKKLTYEAWESCPLNGKIPELFSIPIKEQL